MGIAVRMLTYSDREFLLEALESCSVGEAPEDSELMGRASAAVSRVQSHFGFVEALSRDIASVGAFLRQDLDSAARLRARGMLAFVIQALADESSKFGHLGGAQASTFLADLVAHELRRSLGLQSTYSPFQLTSRDKQFAEDLLLTLLEQPRLSDELLIEELGVFQKRYSALRGTGLLGRFLRHLDMLAAILVDPETAAERRTWARAALAYVIESRDAIDDDLGFAGLLDDAFILNTVVDILNPGTGPWLDLLEAAVEAWPFLNSVVFHNEVGGRPASEFLILNAALACPSLRGEENQKRTALILPALGPIPFFIALLASLGVLQDWMLAEDPPLVFEQGETVCVDNDGYAHFDGFEDWEGQRGVVLRYWDRAGHKIRQWLPAEHLQRLTPATPRAHPQGPVARRWESGKGRLSAIEYIFHLRYPRPFVNIGKRVILVSPVGRTRRLAAEMSLCGLAIEDCLPMGNSTLLDTPPVIWSPRFSSSADPVLLVVPDLDDAAQVLADDPERVALMVLDLRGSNATRSAGLDSALRNSPPVLAITDESEQRAVQSLHERGFVFWEWSKDDLQHLTWPVWGAPINPLARYDRRIHRLTSVDPVIDEVEETSLSAAFDAIQQMQKLARTRGDAVPEELSQALIIAWSSFHSLLGVLKQDEAGVGPHLLEQRFEQLEQYGGSIWLLDQEREAVSIFCQASRRAMKEIGECSPRARRLEILLTMNPGDAVIVRYDRDRTEVASVYSLGPERVSTPYDVSENGLDTGGVIIGWLGRSSMIRLLHPPVANPLRLVLYSIELRWYRSLLDSLERSRQRRRHPLAKRSVFPLISWRQEGLVVSAGDRNSEQKTEADLETVDSCEALNRRAVARCSAMTGTGSGPKCDALLAYFTDESYAFLTPQRRFAVVTSVLDRTSIAAQPEAEERTVSELRPGDVLLLPTNVDRDVIRSAADLHLAVGDREQATQWQSALRRYVSAHGLTVEELRGQLAVVGCRRQAQTIGQWLRSEDLIAPQNAYSGDLEAIGAVTHDVAFLAGIENSKSAIAKVRHAHHTARRRLAEETIGQLSIASAEAGQRLPNLKIDGDLALVRVELIDERPTQVPRNVVNRLLGW